LRTRETLDPGNVVNVDIERSADRGDRLLVQIDTDRGQGSRVVAVTARRDSAHVNDCPARLSVIIADRRKLLGIFLEVRNIELVEPPGPDCDHALRDVLKPLLALG